jgi:hypothetical protein
MNCQFCNAETRMTVKNSKEEIFPCCKECKDAQNGPIDPDTGLRKMKLYVYLVQK